MLHQLWSDLRYRVRALVRRGTLERELADELRDHLEREAAKLERQGTPPAEAWRQARLAFGGVELAKEASRDARGTALIETLAVDLRRACRALIRTPVVTVAAIGCLTVGIGATTAVWSAVSRALLRPLPFRDANRLVAVHRVSPQTGPTGSWPLSPANFADLAQASRQVEGLAAVLPGSALIALPSAPLQAHELYVTGSALTTLGVVPERGRLLGPLDDRPGAAPAAMISDAFWRTRFGGDQSIVGRSVIIDGVSTTVVGVLPPDLRIPYADNVFAAEVWAPTQLTPQQMTLRYANFLWLFGRLAPGATVASADAELRTIYQRLAATYPNLAGDNVRVAPLQGENLAFVRVPLLLLLGAATMVLLIAAVNVAALLLARNVERQRETAIRGALGATRWDVVRPALAESAIIAVAGAIGGVALAAWSVRGIGALAAQRLPQLVGLRVDVRVMAAALLLTIAVSLACGGLPAWRNAHAESHDTLRSSRGSGHGTAHHRTLRSLVVLELGLSLMLLLGAGLVLKAFRQLIDKPPGFDPAQLLTLTVTVTPNRYQSPGPVPGFLDRAIAAVRAAPGVADASAINLMPYVNWESNSPYRYEGRPAEQPSKLPLVEERRATAGFFRVTGQRLLAGRTFTAQDLVAGAPDVVVVNQSLVRRDFPGGDAVGHRFYTSDTTFGTIIGVVSDIRNAGPIADPRPEMYRPYNDGYPATSFPMLISVRGPSISATIPGILAAIRATDPTAAVADIAPMSEVIETSLGAPRFYLRLLGSFASVALVLAVAGLYAVLSYAVVQRTREIGIRAALGGSRTAILEYVVGDGMKLVAMGVALGLAGGLGITRLIGALLYGVSPLDRGVWISAAAVLIAAGAAAVLVPGWRAARVDPLIAIRAE